MIMYQGYRIVEVAGSFAWGFGSNGPISARGFRNADDAKSHIDRMLSDRAAVLNDDITGGVMEAVAEIAVDVLAVGLFDDPTPDFSGDGGDFGGGGSSGDW